MSLLKNAPLTPSALTPEQRGLYDEICRGPRASVDRPAGPVDGLGHLTGPFNAMLYSPAVGGPLHRLGEALRYSSTLPDVTRELVILAVAAHHDCHYERISHRKVAATLDIGETAFGAIEAGLCPQAHPEAAGALELVLAILDGNLPGEDDLAQLRVDLDDATIFELTTLVGYYSTLAVQLALFGVEPPV